MRRTAAALILIISLLMAVPAIAGQFEDAVNAMDRTDFATAYRLFRPLAEQGHAASQVQIGIMHTIPPYTRIIKQDYNESANWFRKAAQQGNAEGQFWLGASYEVGRGVTQNYPEAVKWYRRAAEQGHVQSQLCLAALYKYGLGVPQDYVLAYMWYNIASAFGTYHLDKTGREFRDELASMMTPAQIAEAQKLAREWKPKMEK